MFKCYKNKILYDICSFFMFIVNDSVVSYDVTPTEISETDSVVGCQPNTV